MKINALLAIVTLSIVSISANAEVYGSKSNALKALNKINSEYAACFSSFNLDREQDKYVSAEEKCTAPHKEALTKFITNVRKESKLNATKWNAFNDSHIIFDRTCKGTPATYFAPSYFYNGQLLCEDSAYTSLAQVAVYLSY